MPKISTRSHGLKLRPAALVISVPMAPEAKPRETTALCSLPSSRSMPRACSVATGPMNHEHQVEEMHGAAFEQVDIGIAEGELAGEDGRRATCSAPCVDQRLRHARRAARNACWRRWPAARRARCRVAHERRALAAKSRASGFSTRQATPASIACARQRRHGRRRRRGRGGGRAAPRRASRRRRQTPAAPARCAALRRDLGVRVGDSPTIATGSPMVCSRRIAGIHFACATPPQPAMRDAQRPLRRACRVVARRRRRRRGRRRRRSGVWPKSIVRPAGHARRPRARNTACASGAQRQRGEDDACP